ncbi:hypothetical protein WUBG_04909 [Wuchereria bancrofti]|uniref:Uncharacterized protein n=1 Tax=Wuchereria bancrofti TaxID=6293 RepID=J9EPR5_WUCBA|nr:hypothetical protein WUBG_04909 [Wuchereria bancrofti]
MSYPTPLGHACAIQTPLNTTSKIWLRTVLTSCLDLPNSESLTTGNENKSSSQTLDTPKEHELISYQQSIRIYLQHAATNMTKIPRNMSENKKTILNQSANIEQRIYGECEMHRKHYD